MNYGESVMKKQWRNGGGGQLSRDDMKGARRLFVALVVCLGCALGLWKSREDTTTKSAPSVEEVAQVSPEAKVVSRPPVAVESIPPRPHRDLPEVLAAAGRLSLRVVNRPLQNVVHEIGRQSGVAIAMGEGMPNPSIVMEFRELPLEEGLRRLFQDYDAFFFYSGTDGSPGRLTTVWVYPPGEGQKLAPIPSLQESLRNEWAQDVDDPDALRRALAIATLAERHGNGAAEAVKTGLVDFDERVRVEALQAALNTPVDVPLETLRELVQHDPSAVVRSIAVAGLANRAEQGSMAPEIVWELLEIAQKDADSVVSELATRIAESWDEALAAGAAR
jgi:hypothetical protein